MNFIVFAWIGSMAYGLETIIGKLTSKYSINNPWAFNFLYSLFIFVVTIPLAIQGGAGMPTLWGNLLISSFFTALATTFFVIAIFKLDVSVLSPLFNFRTAISVLLGALFLGEILSTQQYVLVGIIFLAGMFVNLDEKLSLRSFFTLPVAIGLLEMLILSINSMFFKKAATDNGFWTAFFWTGLFGQILLFATIPLFWKSLKTTKLKSYTGVILTAIAGTVGVVSSTYAISKSLSLTTIIISLPTSMFIAFALSVIAPKLLEKHPLKIYAIRFAAAFVMLVCALKLSL